MLQPTDRANSGLFDPLIPWPRRDDNLPPPPAPSDPSKRIPIGPTDI